MPRPTAPRDGPPLPVCRVIRPATAAVLPRDVRLRPGTPSGQAWTSPWSPSHDPHAVVGSAFLAVQAAFVWGRYAVFRIAGTTPAGVRLIEAATVFSIASGSVLIALRNGGHWATDTLALALAAAAASLFGWGVHTVGRLRLQAAFTPAALVDSGRLITDSPFRWLRHPFYTAYLLSHVHAVLASRSAWTLLPLAWMTVIYLVAAVREERKFAASPLAAAYARHARRTGRFWPRLRSASDVRFERGRVSNPVQQPIAPAQGAKR